MEGGSDIECVLVLVWVLLLVWVVELNKVEFEISITAFVPKHSPTSNCIYTVLHVGLLLASFSNHRLRLHPHSQWRSHSE